MKRRSFVRASLLASSIGGVAPLTALASANFGTQKKPNPEFYELRTYTLKNEGQQKIVEDYFQNVAIPALNRFGSRNVGVFRELKPGEDRQLYVVIPYSSLGDYLRMQDNLGKDAAHNQAENPYLNATATAPAYERIENSLFRAFTTMPRMEVPGKKSRIFELRRYESSGELAGKKKIEMFDKGEIEIFKKVGLTPVFFGEALIGTFRPNLTYMLTFDDMEDHDRNWKAFGSDPDWKRISALPEYADAKIVSRITRIFLSPTDFSQI